MCRGSCMLVMLVQLCVVGFSTSGIYRNSSSSKISTSWSRDCFEFGSQIMKFSFSVPLFLVIRNEEIQYPIHLQVEIGRKRTLHLFCSELCFYQRGLLVKDRELEFERQQLLLQLSCLMHSSLLQELLLIEEVTWGGRGKGPHVEREPCCVLD